MRWRYWLVEMPARGSDYLLSAYRVYLTGLMVITGPALVLMVLTMLVLWFGFGIRWGW